MKLNQDMKASILMGLAGLSSKLNINQYSFPKLKNASIYTINSPDNKVNITLNFSQPLNLDQELIDTLNYLNENEHGLPLLETNDDNEILENTCEILNNIRVMYSSLNSINQASQINERMENTRTLFANWWDASNSTTHESRILCGACTLLHATTRTPSNACELIGEDLYAKLINEFKGFSDFIIDFKETAHIDWDRRKKEALTEDHIKQEAKLITTATLTELISCSFSVIRALEDTGYFKYSPTILDFTDINNLQNEKTFFFHEKENKDKDLNTLKKDIYTILFNTFGYTDKPIKTMKEADQYDNFIGETAGQCYNTHALTSSYDMYRTFFPCMDLHMQKVVETLILNHASLSGINVPGLPKINPQDLTFDRLGDITDINYETVTNPNRRFILSQVLKIAQKDLNKNRKIALGADSLLNDESLDFGDLQNPDETIEEYLKRLESNLASSFETINKIREEQGEEPIIWGDDNSIEEMDDFDEDFDNLENNDDFSY